MIAANHGHLVSIASCAGLCGGSQASGSVLKLILMEVISFILNSSINIHGEKKKNQTDSEFLDLSVQLKRVVRLSKQLTLNRPFCYKTFSRSSAVL